MNQEIKKLWIEALLSGEYTQGQCFLYFIGKDKVKRHCVLGVLCDLAYKEGIITRSEEEDWGIKFYERFHSADLPSKVWEWSKINVKCTLDVRMKNDCGVPFSDLVKIIETF